MPKLKALDAVTFTRHVNQLRDRGSWELVMLGASLLDIALKESITRNTVELSSNERNRWDNGVARGLSARIDTAWALGLLTLRSARECHKLRDLRNEMAHTITIESLDDPRSMDIIGRFKYYDRETIEFAGGEVASAKPHEGEPRPGELDTIRDRDGKVGFSVPSSRGVDFTDVEARVRHQIWSCIYVAVLPALTDWLRQD